MKVVLLAAGKGTRMMPLTKDTPKPLLKINGKPFLYYMIERLKKAGYTEFGIIYSVMKDQFERFMDEYNVNGTLIMQENQLGTGDALKKARAFIGEDDFVMIYADNIFSVDDYKHFNLSDDFCYVSGLKHEHPENYGVLLEKDGYLREIVEKPKEFVGNLISAGIFKFTPAIFDALDKIELSPRGEYELTDAVTILAEKKKVKVVQVSIMVDFGKLEDVPKVESYLSDE
ncbi:MAG: sugar phosphate nucleotidyltransferase [Nanoarchaeota archaeon]|nr:sugar phosphate nucleotidyltransferase [Nanoarchaeota archaeon]